MLARGIEGFAPIWIPCFITIHRRISEREALRQQEKQVMIQKEKQDVMR
jgi:hypothetical protein